jgi:outer membrane protein OmpA-like peptidoglycan-associated protein
VRTSADHRSPWRPLHPVLPLLAATLLLSSCVSGGDGDDGNGAGGGTPEASPSSSEGSGALASALTTGTFHKSNLRVEITSFERESDDVAVLEMTVSNLGENQVRVSDMFMDASRRGGVGNTADGISLIDGQNLKRYTPLMRTDEDQCLCSRWDAAFLNAEESLELWVAFPAPPEDVESMGVTTNVTPDFVDVPLSEAQTPDEQVTSAAVQEPSILDLTSYQDDLSGDSSREDTGDETSIMLASDVLFDTNESELTPEADAALEQVAQEIDDSSGSTVRIDGYTDNTGDDSINNPLSEDRAQSVQDALSELVTRDGVTFESAGHGSSDPVATNDTEEGRQKNRRVTISFEK